MKPKLPQRDSSKMDYRSALAGYAAVADHAAIMASHADAAWLDGRRRLAHAFGMRRERGW